MYFSRLGLIIRPHRIHAVMMRHIDTDVARSVVCVSVCLCVGHMGALCKNG